MTDHDTIARMAIRLARSYHHGWATRIPKTHGVAWNWVTASEYARGHRSEPRFDRDKGTIVYDTGKMTWSLGPERIEVNVRTQSGEACSVVAKGDPTPRLVVTVPDLSALVSHDLWKLDVAVTSLCCGPWKPLHELPPLRVLFAALAMPKTPCALVYEQGEVRARLPDDLETAHPFDELLAEFGRRGGFRRWEKLIVRRPLTAKEGV